MKKKVSIITIILYIFLFTLIASFLFLYHFQKKLGPELITCAENQVKDLTTLVTNNSIRKFLQKESPNYIIKEKDEKGEITFITYNTKEINKTTSQITKIIETDLKNLMQGNIKDIELNTNIITQEYYEKINNGIIFTVSIGTATGNSLLANIGPKIPLKLKLVGGVTTKIESEVKEYGLNNALIEISAITKVTTVIQMPFLSKEVILENKIPLTMEIIQGNIPKYYIGNKT